MKLNLLNLFFVIGSALPLGAFAQNQFSDAAPVNAQQVGTSDRAQWDVQLFVDPNQITVSLAGVYWTGTEFWLSKWSDDSLFTANASGVKTSGFVIPGISATRSITSDGTFLYLSNNSNTIYKVNPSTKTLVSSFTSSASGTTRYISYDPTLNSGAGGFWTGNFATDWVAISTSGAVLSTIAQSTHGLSGVYGLVYDQYTPGGPYLWASDQSGANSVMLIQHSVLGVPTGLSYDPTGDIPVTPGIAGGAFACNNFVSGTASLGLLSQNVALLVYEMGSNVSVNDAEPMQCFSVFPNPASDAFSIEFESKSGGEIQVLVSDILGKTVHSANYYPLPGKNRIQINSLPLENGMYMVSIVQGGIVNTTQLVVSK